MLTRPGAHILNPTTSPIATLLTSHSQTGDAQSLRTTFAGWGPRL